jgi:POT family proton-dependent oligopeptide transporter
VKWAFPKGAVLLIGVEFCERFSFYGMLSILALFLTAAPDAGGFGWPAARALSLVGAYSGAMYALPAFGGYLADRVIGRRRAVTLGASCMLMGEILLAATRGAAGFYAAIALLIVGNALMKSTLVVLVGETMTQDDPRREAAFAYYYLGIAVAAMLSGFAVGVAAERFGWHAGFAVAAAGMSVALGAYVWLAPRWLGQIGILPERKSGVAIPTSQGAQGTALQSRLEALRRIGLLLVLAALLCAFSIGWFQLYGSWLLFIEQHVDRTAGSFVIPVPWFTSMNAAVVIVLAPAVAALWVKLGARNQHIDILQKYTFALATVTLGNGLMYICARSAGSEIHSSVWPPIFSLALLGLGELVAWTATYEMVSKAAPAGYASVTMGAWYLLTLGLGGYLSGFTGGMVDVFGFVTTFAAVTVAMAAACLVAAGIRGPMARLAGRARVTL